MQTIGLIGIVAQGNVEVNAFAICTPISNTVSHYHMWHIIYDSVFMQASPKALH